MGRAFAFPAETTSKILAFASNGRFYTVDASKLPGGRGHGEPIRLYADIEQDGELVSVFRYQGGRKFLVASKSGRGFVVAEDECLANTRKGKQVLNVKPPDAARAVAPVEGELVAAVGENRKMVIFRLDQVPEMGRGRGVRLQRHKDGGLSDVTTFKADDGLRWIGEGGRTFEPLHQGARRLARQPRRRRPRAPRPLPRQSEIRQAPRKRQRQERQRQERRRRGEVSRALSLRRGAERAPRTTLGVSSPQRRWSDRTFPGWRLRSRQRTAFRRAGAPLP